LQFIPLKDHFNKSRLFISNGYKLFKPIILGIESKFYFLSIPKYKKVEKKFLQASLQAVNYNFFAKEQGDFNF
jgi:hypothetical protein